MKLKKVGVLSFAIFEGIFSAIIGLIMGLLSMVMFSAINTIMPLNAALEDGSVIAAPSLGILGIIKLIIVWGVMGFILGAVFALIYNLIAKWTGGIDLEFHK